MDNKFKTKICARCGKTIELKWYRPKDYLYKRSGKFYCSLKCYTESLPNRRNVV